MARGCRANAIDRVVCLALLITLALSISSVIAHPAFDTRAPEAPDEVALHSNFIPVQGRLTDAAGVPLHGTYTANFRVYASEEGGEKGPDGR